jgi:hypothetical protein
VTLQVIVEGYGEVGAVPVLLKRLRKQCAAFRLRIGRPHRRPQSQLLQRESLQNAIEALLAQADDERSGILILFDGDDHCPREVGPRIQRWAQEHARGIPCEVVVAWREYEAWFLANVGSVIPGAPGHENPEGPRNAKGALSARMPAGKSYQERIDQELFTKRFDMAAAHRRCRSFQRVVRAFGLLAAALGVQMPQWPPPEWEDR